jgi:hypothetical protein
MVHLPERTGRLSPGERAALRRFLTRLLERAEPGTVAWVRVFGSRARGLSGEESDLDIAVQAAPGADRLRLRDVAADAAWDAMAEKDAFRLRLAPVVLPAPEPVPPAGLHAAIAREGIPLWPPT